MNVVEKFYKDVETNADLKSQIEALYKAQNERRMVPNEQIVKVANNAGYNFSVEELNDYQETKHQEFTNTLDSKTPGNPWTCWERWLSFNFACGWDSGFPWKCQYKDECKKHC